MAMETTVNMHRDILKRITRAAEVKGISRSGIIMLVIKEMMNHLPDADYAGTMVRYQECRKPDEWHTFHIRIRMDEYEYMLDLRKLFKMSVSLVIAYGVKRYLNKLIKFKGADNNRFTNYAIIREIIDNIICWKLYWGCPPDLGKLIPRYEYSTSQVQKN